VTPQYDPQSSAWIGSAWIGDAWIGGIGQLNATLRDRLLTSVRNGPRFSNLVGIFASRSEAIALAAQQIREAFDLENGTGVHLDRLGEILQRRRLGESDERYRVLLQIQVQLILSSAATSGVLTQVIRLFTGQEPTEYNEHHPAQIIIGAALDSEADARTLRQLLTEGRAGGVSMTLAADVFGDVLVVDSDASPVTDPGNVDSDAVVVTDAHPIVWNLEA